MLDTVHSWWAFPCRCLADSIWGRGQFKLCTVPTMGNLPPQRGERCCGPPGTRAPESSFFFQSCLLLPFPYSFGTREVGGDRRRKNKNHRGTSEPPRRPAFNPVLHPFHIIGEGFKNPSSSHPQQEDQRDIYLLTSLGKNKTPSTNCGLLTIL